MSAKQQQPYSKYFKEFLPNENPAPQRQYSVSLHRAVFTKESFQVFQRYEAFVHKKPGKTHYEYERFLCQSSLFDPSNPKEAKWRAEDMGDSPDKLRECIDEGVSPHCATGSTED